MTTYSVKLFIGNAIKTNINLSEVCECNVTAQRRLWCITL